MKIEQLHKMLRSGKIAKVRFIKRTTGLERVMICRMGVHKGLSGDPNPRYDPADHGLVTVYDMQVGGYRNIPVDSILEVKSGKEHYVQDQD
jgi:hypothetical protein